MSQQGGEYTQEELDRATQREEMFAMQAAVHHAQQRLLPMGIELERREAENERLRAELARVQGELSQAQAALSQAVQGATAAAPVPEGGGSPGGPETGPEKPSEGP